MVCQRDTSPDRVRTQQPSLMQNLDNFLCCLPCGVAVFVLKQEVSYHPFFFVHLLCHFIEGIRIDIHHIPPGERMDFRLAILCFFAAVIHDVNPSLYLIDQVLTLKPLGAR